ncbi:MAG: hypothetical protein IH927_02850 [Proteobacteria bacterium]|nr:hypothetical protein [Pseudomonadota bacterium]
MHWFTGLFLFFLALVTITRLFLAPRQIDGICGGTNNTPRWESLVL